MLRFTAGSVDVDAELTIPANSPSEAEAIMYSAQSISSMDVGNITDGNNMTYNVLSFNANGMKLYINLNMFLQLWLYAPVYPGGHTPGATQLRFWRPWYIFPNKHTKRRKENVANFVCPLVI